MKVTMTEYAECFSFDLSAETLQDAALLTRFATNSTNDLRSKGACAHEDVTFSGYCVIGKRKNADGGIRSKNK